jgi:SH3 domain protein
MRPTILLLCGVLCFPTLALGKSLYVSGYREVLLRTGPSLENKILVILKTGEEVSVLGEEGGYYLVATPNGRRGYVLKTYMTDQRPAEARLQEIEQQSQERIQALEAKTQEQEQELTTLREERAQLLTAKQQAETTANEQTELVSQLQAQQDTTTSERERGWFIAGAGVLLTGLLLGWMWGRTGRRNRKSGLSLERF